VQNILRQPASLTLWTYLELQDADRIDALVERSGRYEEAALIGVAMSSGKEFQRADAAFRATLRRHPDPDVEARMTEQALRDAMPLIERVTTIGGKS
jgi:hypothetical protein